MLYRAIHTTDSDGFLPLLDSSERVRLIPYTDVGLIHRDMGGSEEVRGRVRGSDAPPGSRGGGLRDFLGGRRAER